MKLVLLSISFLFFRSYETQDLVFSSKEFLQAVLKKYPEIDLNKDGEIQQNEAELVKELDLIDQNLKSAEDVNKFKNIEELSLSLNQIEKIKLDDFKYLTHLYCAGNNLKELEISNMPKLAVLACGVNLLAEVTIKNCPNITSLNIMDNQIKSIDLTQFKKLEGFVADNNKLEKLDISNNTELTQIIINGNDIKTIDITKNQKLKMNILYIDKDVDIIGTTEQMSKYKPIESLETLGN